MKEVITSSSRHNFAKGPIVDLVFERSGRRFVKPAPPMIERSWFYKKGRPRANEYKGVPFNPRICPRLTREQWMLLRRSNPSDARLHSGYNMWKAANLSRIESSRPEDGVASIEISFTEIYNKTGARPRTITYDDALSEAVSLFNTKIQKLFQESNYS